MKEDKTKITHDVIEKSHLYLDLSASLLTKIDLFFSNVDLTNKQQQQVMSLFEEVYGEGYTNCITD